jgi:predicted metal-dependent enzyme (double-stranded beta helix superfamily)
MVADVLRADLPGVDILSGAERVGNPDQYIQHVLHVEPGGSFSVVAVVWLPNQVTPIHDHVSWCVFGVLRGAENETLYRVEGDHLVTVGGAENHAGQVSGFAPPGDIHSVRNSSGVTAISLHIYGADIDRLGSSIRRTYDLPVIG